MNAITITLSDERAKRQSELAASGLSPEELLRESVDQWLEKPANDFVEAAADAIRKNSELYQRLAK